MLRNLTIKSKSFLLIGTFLLILILNGIGSLLATSHVQTKNKQFELETEKVLDFANLKYLLRALQETATDTTLMGDGYERLEKLKKEYLNAIQEMKSMHFSKEDYQNLKLLNSNFNNYYKALTSMATAGVKRTKTKTFSKILMEKFDNDVINIGNL